MSETADETTEEPETQEQDGPEPATEPTPEEEEAEAAESEQVEGHPATPEEGEQPSGAAGAVGERELEKMFKRVETANATYSRKLGEIMGEESHVLEQCPRCASPFLGFIFPPLMQPVSPEVKDKVLISVGEQPAAASEPDKYSRRCDACAGMGVVLSGSRTNRDRTLTCYDCKGRGWIPVGDERRVGAPDIAPAPSANGPTETIEQPPDQDPWGRTPGDPDYGRMPQYVGRA